MKQTLKHTLWIAHFGLHISDCTFWVAHFGLHIFGLSCITDCLCFGCLYNWLPVLGLPVKLVALAWAACITGCLCLGFNCELLPPNFGAQFWGEFWGYNFAAQFWGEFWGTILGRNFGRQFMQVIEAQSGWGNRWAGAGGTLGGGISKMSLNFVSDSYMAALTSHTLSCTVIATTIRHSRSSHWTISTG